MTAYLLRRRKLGNGSCKGIVAKSKKGIRVFRNDAVLPEADLVIRWGCTSNVPSRNVLNKAEAIHLVGDKLGFRRILNEEDLCPATWFNIDDPITYPCIVRPRTHAQGRKLHVCNNRNELLLATSKYPMGYYISALINKVSEYRVFIVQGRVVCVARKYPADENTVAWNVAQGGRFENVKWDEWPLKAVKHSIQAFNLSGLDFGGVDIMIDAEGNDYVLEINSACSLTSDYRQECFAKAFDYIIDHGKEQIPLIEEKGGYKKFIHPAVCDQAILVNA